MFSISDLISKYEALIKESQDTQIRKSAYVIAYGKYVKESFVSFDASDMYAMTSKDLNQISTEIHNISPFPCMDVVKLVSQAEAKAYVDAHPYLYNGRKETYIGCVLEMEEYKEILIKYLQNNLKRLQELKTQL